MCLFVKEMSLPIAPKEARRTYEDGGIVTAEAGSLRKSRHEMHPAAFREVNQTTHRRSVWNGLCELLRFFM